MTSKYFLYKNDCTAVFGKVYKRSMWKLIHQNKLVYLKIVLSKKKKDCQKSFYYAKKLVSSNRLKGHYILSYFKITSYVFLNHF